MLALLLAAVIALLPAAHSVKTACASGTASISASGGSCTVGNKVKVTVVVSASADIGVVDYTLRYDASVLTYAADDKVNGALRECDYSITGKSKTYTYEFIGKKAGTYTITVAASKESVLPLDPAVGDTFDSVSVKNATVTVNPPYQASNNANLGKLSVGEGTLSPAFSKNTTEYSVNVDGAVTALTVSAKSEDGKGKVSVSGNKDLKEGANTVTVVCTAEDGKTKKTYTLTVYRGPAPTPTPTPTPTPGLIKKVGEQELTLLDEFNKDLPEGFTGDTTEIEGFTVAVATGGDGTTKLVQMDDGQFYVMSGDGQFYLYQMVESLRYQYAVVPKPAEVEVPDGFVPDTSQVFGPNGEAWVTDSDPNVLLLYLRSPSGTEGWYLYDRKEQSVQSFKQTLYAPSPTPTPEITPTEEAKPTPTDAPGGERTTPDASSDSGSGMLGALSTREQIGGGIMIALLLMTIIFLVLFVREHKRRTLGIANAEARAEEEEMNKTFDPRLLLTEEEENSAAKPAYTAKNRAGKAGKKTDSGAKADLDDDWDDDDDF